MAFQYIVLSGADVVFNSSDSTSGGLIGLGSEINAITVENNVKGVYKTNGSYQIYPAGVEALNMVGNWELKTNVASKSFLQWIIENALKDGSLPSSLDFYVSRVYYPSDTDVVSYTLKHAFISSFNVNLREGEPVELTASGIFREVAQSGTANREAVDSVVIPAVYSHSNITLSGVTLNSVIRSASISVDYGVEPVSVFGDRRFGGVKYGQMKITGSLTLALGKNDWALVDGTGLISYATKESGFTNFDPKLITSADFVLGMKPDEYYTLTLSDILVDKVTIRARPNEVIEVDVDFIATKITGSKTEPQQ